MEDALVLGFGSRFVKKVDVLILVLMEDALVLKEKQRNAIKGSSLNPCFNGRCTST